MINSLCLLFVGDDVNNEAAFNYYSWGRNIRLNPWFCSLTCANCTSLWWLWDNATLLERKDTGNLPNVIYSITNSTWTSLGFKLATGVEDLRLTDWAMALQWNVSSNLGSNKVFSETKLFFGPYQFTIYLYVNMSHFKKNAATKISV
jgi:hypothetical protein